MSSGARVNVVPCLVLQVINHFENNHEHIPAVLLSAEFQDLGTLVERPGDLLEILLEYAVAPDCSMLPFILEGEVRPAGDDLLFEFDRIGELVLGADSLEPAYEKTINRDWRIGHGDINAPDSISSLPEYLPNSANVPDCAGGIERQLIGVHVVAFEVDDPVRAGSLAGHEGRPKPRA